MNLIVLWLEKITKNTGRLFAWLILLLVLSLCYEVFARYLFRKPTIWAFDATYMLLAAIFLVGSAYTLAEKRHIRIDFFYNGFSPHKKAIINVLGFLILFLPVISYVAYFGVGKLIESIATHELSDVSPWHPIMWPFRACIAIGFILLAIQGVCEIIKNWIILFDKQHGEKND